jgi:hypothetical protein
VNRQRGNIWIYGIIALLVVAAGVTAVRTYNGAIERATKAEAAAQEWQENAEAKDAALARLLVDGQKKDRLLTQRQARRNQDEAKERQTDDNLQKSATDPIVRAWLDAPVPQSLVDGLRGPAVTAGKAGGGSPLPSVAKPAPAGAGR